ncbi:hypothetical protein [Nitratireductor sp. XY-223]|uniref:hypothetical protein n=1 Tax=Nitratireductor sp. XY-223 TaxID=2561926 RepID=UPI0010A9B3BF|nr:hypothetical protein [Nitratireductor sp. XY-223]
MLTRPFRAALPLLIAFLLVAKPIAAAELLALTLDFAALEEGVPGTAGYASVWLDADEEAEFYDERDWTLSVGSQVLIGTSMLNDRGLVHIRLFDPRLAWPREGEKREHDATLSYRDRVVATAKATGPANGIATLGGGITASDLGDATLTERFEAGYFDATSENQRIWFSGLSGESNWFELGLIAHRRNAFREAAYFFARAADADPADGLAAAWLARTLHDTGRFEADLLLAVEADLQRRLSDLETRGARAAAAFGEAQQRATERERELQAEFAGIQDQLAALPDRSETNPDAARLAERLKVINAEIRALGESLNEEIAGIERTTPFMTRMLFETQLMLARIAAGQTDMNTGKTERDWVEAARRTAEVPYAQDFNPVGVDRSLRARILIRQAALANREAEAEQAALQADPAYRERLARRQHHDEQLSALNVMKSEAEAAAAALPERPDLMKLSDEAARLAARFDTAQTEHQARLEALDVERNELQAARDALGGNPSSEAIEGFNARLDAFNANVDLVNARVPELQAMADTANAAANAYNEALNRANEEVYAPYNDLVAAANANLDAIRALSEELADREPRYKDLVFERDGSLALARSELYSLMGERPTPEGDSLIDAVDTAVSVPDGAEKSDVGTPWCDKVDFRCDQCIGLGVLGCTFAESDAQSACYSGERVLFRKPAPGGGIIGGCGGTLRVDPGTRRWSVQSTERNPGKRSRDEEAAADDVIDVASGLLDPFFDPAAGCGLASPVSAGEADDGLGAYLDEFEQMLADRREERRAERQRAERLEQMQDYIDLLSRHAGSTSSDDLEALRDRISATPDLMSDPDAARDVAEQLSKIAQEAVVAGAASLGTENGADGWQDWAEKTMEIGEKVKAITDELGIKSDTVDEIKGYVDSARELRDAINEARTTGSSEKLRGIFKDKVISALGPVGQVIDLPADIINSGLNVVERTTGQISKPLGHMSDLIAGTDPDAEAKMLAAVEELQNTSAKDIIKEVALDPFERKLRSLVGDRAVDVTKAIYEYFTKEEKAESASCPVPPLEFG